MNYAMNQIESVFRWNRPAVISSHRVNFSGNISPDNRKQGIRLLKLLLTKIVNKWPSVEFISSVELMDIIAETK